METTDSKKKVEYARDATENVAITTKSLVKKMDELKGVADHAQYAAMDRVYNEFAKVSAQFGDLCGATTDALHKILMTLEKDHTRGDAFTAQVKKALTEVEATMGKTVEFPMITAERDGEEKWDNATQANAKSVLCDILRIRKNYINALGDITARKKDPIWGPTFVEIGKKNEEFTNSWVDMFNEISDQLTAIGIDLTKELSEVEAAAKGVNKVSNASSKFNIAAGDM